MIIYIDSDCKCHVTNDGTMDALETDYFDGKCQAYIEGHRFVPFGKSWVRDDGVVFSGQMVAPWRNYSELAEIQKAVDANDAKRDEELAALIEEIYQQDLEMIDG